jgi:DNA-binding XRE family transcriptional regulator
LEKEENLVKKTCRELGITQKELAKKIGVSTRTLTNWSNKSIKIPQMAINLIEMFYIYKEYIELQKNMQIVMERRL